MFPYTLTVFGQLEDSADPGTLSGTISVRTEVIPLPGAAAGLIGALAVLFGWRITGGRRTEQPGA